VLAAGLLTACASHPDSIAAIEESALKYQGLDCAQLETYAGLARERHTRLYNTIASQATGDAWQAGLALVFFPPTVLLLEGPNQEINKDYAKAKGDLQNITRVATRRNCGFAFNGTKPETESAALQASAPKFSEDFMAQLAQLIDMKENGQIDDMEFIHRRQVLFNSF
jgi:hypothetical protein